MVVSEGARPQATTKTVARFHGRLRDILGPSIGWLRQRSPIWPTIVAVFVVYATYALTRSAQYKTAGYDLGIFDQALRAYARFQPPIVPLKGIDYNLLGDHFHPILLTLVPFYWIWNDARVLLLAQAALIALSCWFVWRIATRRFSRGLSWLLVAGYALGWPVQLMIDYEFHEVAFAVPLIAWALDALDARKDTGLLVASGLLLFVREDMGAIVFILGIVRLFRRPRWYGAMLMLVGVAAFAIIVHVIMPAIADAPYGYWDYSVLGNSAIDAMHTVLTDPWKVIADFFTPIEKAGTLGALFCPLLLLSFLSPYTLLAFPLLAERMLGDREALWGVFFHYNAPVWIILAIGAIDGLSRLIRHPRLSRSWMPRAAAITIASISLAYSLVPLTPVGRLIFGSAFTQSVHDQASTQILSDVPEDVCVTADDHLVPPLIRKDRVTVPGVPTPRADYYLIDTRQTQISVVNGQTLMPEDILRDVLAHGYRLIESIDGIELLQAPNYIGPTSECAP